MSVFASEANKDQTSETTVRSELGTVLSAAFKDFAADGTRYSDLYIKYLGVHREPPTVHGAAFWIPLDQITEGSTLDEVLKRGVIRFGFFREAPYHSFDSEGKQTGFDFELANAMLVFLHQHYPKLRVEWVEQKIELPGAGQDNVVAYERLLPGLLNKEYDVIFSGIIDLPARPVATTCATMDFFWNVIYTGKDDWDVKSILNSDRTRLVEFLAGKPGASIVSTAGGPSQEVAQKLVADVNTAGGSAHARTASIPELKQMFSVPDAHITIGDAIAQSSMAIRPGFRGSNLNIVLKAEHVIAPVTRLAP